MAHIIRLTNSATIIEPEGQRPTLVVDKGKRVEIPLGGGELADFKLMGLADGATHAGLASGGGFTALAHNVIALRVGSDLILEYADGTQIVLKGFFAPNIGVETSGGEGFTVELSAKKSTTISISSTSTGKKLSATSELIALRGDELTLKQLAYDNFALRSEVATVFANANTPAGSSLVWSATKDGAQSLAGAGLGASNAGPIALGVVGLAAGAAASKNNKGAKITFSITSDPGDDDSYNVNDVIQITVNSPQAATVTGVPTLTLMIGTGTRSAAYDADKSTANKLVFEYTVQGGDWDTDGISIPQNSITLPTGATIVNAQNIAIDFSHSAIARNSGHKVRKMQPRMI